MKTLRLLSTVSILILILNSCSSSNDNNNDLDCTLTPTLTTGDAVDITDVKAGVSGQIIAPTCEGSVTSQGFVYAETTLPKIDDFVVELNGENIFAEIADLQPNTKYYVRTFFENPTGAYYGNQIEFKTSIGEVNISTKPIENITNNSAKSGGIISDDGGATIISQGICWSTSPNPTINNFKAEDGSGTTDFTLDLTELTEDTTYYVRAYATNEAGTTYGEEESFKTLKSTFKVELKITGYVNSCGVQADYFYYEVNFKFDDNEPIFEAAEGSNTRTLSHVQEGKINNNLEIIIHLAQFDPSEASDSFTGAYLDNMSILVTDVATNQEVLNKELPSLFICADSAYKNIINLNPNNGSYTVDRQTYGF